MPPGDGPVRPKRGPEGWGIFYPSCIVRLLVEVLEPFQGRILDPACGSGGILERTVRDGAQTKR
jgi:type I restriction enzyme M protein